MCRYKFLGILLCCYFFFNGCATQIKGLTNINLYKKLPSPASYSIENVLGDPILNPKIEKMLHYQMKNWVSNELKNNQLMLKFCMVLKSFSMAKFLTPIHSCINLSNLLK